MNELQKELVILAIEQVSLNGGQIRVNLCGTDNVDIINDGNRITLSS